MGYGNFVSLDSPYFKNIKAIDKNTNSETCCEPAFTKRMALGVISDGLLSGDFTVHVFAKEKGDAQKEKKSDQTAVNRIRTCAGRAQLISSQSP